LTQLQLLTDEMDKGFRDEATREVNEATDFVESAPYPGTEDFFDHVYASDGGESSS
jgi:2-oxoisovalerate dehydrogenase E1 component alpha subunit